MGGNPWVSWRRLSNQLCHLVFDVKSSAFWKETHIFFFNFYNVMFATDANIM